MPDFFGVWLSISVCTWGAVFYRYVGDLDYASTPTVAVLALELASLIVWALYWVVLYPKYFTPFLHLPTPSVRTLWWGNRKQFFPDHAWHDIKNVFETLPNEGLVRYYEPLNREVLLATKTEVIKEMFSLKTNDFGHPKNVQFLISQLTGSKFNFLSPHGHKAFRKYLRPAFTTGHTRKVMRLVLGKSDRMIELIHREIRETTSPRPVINLRDYIRRTMWDIFGLTVLGHDFETLEKPAAGAKDRFSGILQSLNGSAIKWGYFIVNYVDVRPLLAVLSPLLLKSSVGKALEKIRSTIRQAVEERQSASQVDSKAPLLVDPGVDLTSVSIASGAFPTDELVDNGMLFLTAGPNSTGTAVEWAIYEIARNAEMQNRLRQEISSYLSSAEPGSESEAELLRNLQSLPYLRAICNEVIRHYPFVPLAPRVAERDTTLLGEHIPKGTIIMTPVEAFNHDKALWGPDADDFNPDRWLGEGEGSGGASNSYAMLSFGAGPGACIGQNYARAMMACLTAVLVREFNIELANAETAGQLRAAPFMRSEEGVLVRLTAVRRG
ncbi:cytochrome P450 [Xylariales sp. PMI_506]|nr:cytochrome P450 [Xylariales sp. PMI_506]